MLSIVIILIISAIIVTLINVYCCVVIISSKKVNNTSHMTIFSLLLGHAIQGLLVIPCYAAKRSGIYKNTVVCDIFRFSYLFTNYACCLSVLVISVDRFVGVQFPLRYKSWITSKKTARVLLFVWIYVFVLCCIPFYPTGRASKCKYNPRKWWVMMMLVGNTLLPFIIIIFCYMVIIKKVKTVLRSRQSRTNDLSRNAKNLGEDIKLTKLSRDTRIQLKRTTITYFIVATYVICWGPSFVYNMLLHLCPNACFPDQYDNSDTEKIVGFVTKLLTFVDGIIAPTIYCCSNANFNVMRKRLLSNIRKRVCTDGSVLVRKKAVRKSRMTSIEVPFHKKCEREESCGEGDAEILGVSEDHTLMSTHKQ